MIDFEPFWCCLGENEQAMLNFMGSWLALPDPVVSIVTYDTMWESLFDEAHSEWYDLWAAIWEITFQEVEIVPGVFVDAAVWTLEGYLSFALFVGSEAYSCPKPCPLSSGAFALPP